MRNPVSNIRRGFLLMEVIFAIAVFGIAATGFAMALHRMADLGTMARDEMRITRILESAIDEAISMPTMQEGENTVRLGEGDVDVRTRVEPMREELQNQDGQQLQEMFRITVTASWYQNGRFEEKSAEVWRYGRLYQP